jgi:hypothetical protein
MGRTYKETKHMRRLLLALLAPVGTLVVPTTAHAAVTPVVHRTPSVIKLAQWHSLVVAQHASASLAHLARISHLSAPVLRQQWQRVAICEVAGNWHMQGPFYSGIGFLNSSWVQYGGHAFAPVAGRATRDEQILVGMRITGGYVPDQYGCSPIGW